MFQGTCSEAYTKPCGFLFSCLFGFFIIIIMMLTTAKWITEQASAEHWAETCLGQEQVFIYLTLEMGKVKTIPSL